MFEVLVEPPSQTRRKSKVLPLPSAACAFQKGLFLSPPPPGGDEPGEAQLGAPQRGPPRPDHGGGHAQPGQDQAAAGHQRGQEAAGARCEYESRPPGPVGTRSALTRWLKVLCVGMHGGGKGIVRPKSVCLCLFVFLCVTLCV